MGLERLACVIQGVDNLFEVDTIRKILDTVCAVAGVKYGENPDTDMSVRVITDQIPQRYLYDFRRSDSL